MRDADLSSSSDDRLAGIIDEFIELRRRGESPSLSSLCGADPELERDIRELLPLVGQVEAARPSNWQTESMPRRIGSYLVEGELGRGAMGIVYRTKDESLDRYVALKVLTHFAGEEGLAKQRFRAECKAIARLNHRNIVPIFDVGESDGLCFYTMPLIQGVSLDRFSLTQLPESPSEIAPLRSLQKDRWHVFANLLAQAADGLAHAHTRGVVHRDIKPSNLILDRDWTLWVTDFGLAKLEDQQLTRSGDMPGTLRYMPPERLHGTCDERSDIYGLGATAYEVCTGAPLILSRDRPSILREIDQDEPRFARSVNPRIPRDLEAIIHKCVAKDPKRRYPDANTLANDLRCFASGKSITARKVSTIGHLMRWTKRHRKAALAATLAVCFLLAAVAALGRLAVVESRGRRAAELVAQRERDLQTAAAESTRIAQELARSELRRRYVAEINLAGRLASSGNGLRRVHDLVSGWDGDALAIAGWEWKFLKRLSAVESIPIGEGPNESPIHLTTLADRVVYSDSDVLTSRDLANSQLWSHRFDFSINEIVSSEEAQWVAAATDFSILVIALDGTLIGEHETPNATSLAWLTEGQLAFVSKDQVHLWDVDAKKVESLDTPSGIRALHQGGGYLVAEADDNLILTACAPNWEWTAWNIGRHSAIAVSPVETLVAIARGGTVGLYDLVSQELVNRIEAHRQRIELLTWDPTGSLLAVSSTSGQVKVWDLGRSSEDPALLLRPEEFCFEHDLGGTPSTLEFASSDSLVAVLEKNGQSAITAHHIGVEQSTQAWACNVHRGSRSLLGWSSSEHAWILADAGSGIVGSSRKGQRVLETEPATAVAVAPDGSRIAYINRQRQLRIGDRLGNEQKAIEGKFSHALGWLNDQELVVAIDGNGLSIFDLGRNKWKSIPNGLQRVRRIAARHSKEFAAVTRDGWLSTYDRAELGDATWREKTREFIGQGLMGLCYSPDGKQIAVTHDRGVSIRNATDLQEVKTLSGHQAGVFSVAWHPHEPRLASCGADRRVLIWDVDSGETLLALTEHQSPVQEVLWSPDGRQLASVGSRGFLVIRSL